MKLSWNASELNIYDISEEYFNNINEDCKDLLEICEMERDNKCMKLFPFKTNVYINDNERIEECDNFNEFIDYYSRKQDIQTDDKLLVFTDKECIIENIGNNKKYNGIYKELLTSVNIDIPGIDKSKINFSPLIFSKIKEEILNNNDKSTDALDFVVEFLSLIAIVDRVIYDGKKEHFYFIINNPQKDFQPDNPSHLTLRWKDYNKTRNNIFYKCYLWITSDENKGIDIEQRRNIVRNCLIKKENPDDLIVLDDNGANNVIKLFDESLKIVISNKTEEYFNNRRMMKDEFVELYKKSDEINSNIKNRILSLVIAIAVGIYGIVFVDGQILDWTQKNRNMSILFIIFLVAEFFVLLSYIDDLVAFKKYKKGLKEIYGTQLLMDTKEWEEALKTRNHIFPSVSVALIIIGTVYVIKNFW